MIQDLAALGVVLHVCDQDVDLALLKKLNPRGGQHGHQLHLRAQPFAEFVRQVHVKTTGCCVAGSSEPNGLPPISTPTASSWRELILSRVASAYAAKDAVMADASTTGVIRRRRFVKVMAVNSGRRA